MDTKLCGDHIEIAKKTEGRYSLQSRMKNWDGKRFMTTEYDWGKPVGNEVW